MPRFDRTIRVSILWDRGHHRHKNDIINNNSTTNGMLNPRRDTRWFLVDRRKTKWNIFHPCVPVIDFDEGRAGWELMIANRGLHRSQPIWITLHRSTVPLRIVHDRFSCSASLSLSPPLSLFLFLLDRFGIRSQPIPRSSELCYAVWRRTLRKRSVIHEE